MIEADFDRIERALAFRLPESYRRGLAPFPIPRLMGNADTQVWDAAGPLVALNDRVRSEVADWPGWLFVIGQSERDPCGYAIDTRSPGCPVWWLERMRFGPNSGPSEGLFAAWLGRWIAHTAPEEPSGRSCLRVFVAWMVLSVSVAVACWLWAT